MPSLPQRRNEKAKRTITVSLPVDTAYDLVTVLRKFSEQKMERLLVGNYEQASRLLALNLFRADVEAALHK